MRKCPGINSLIRNTLSNSIYSRTNNFKKCLCYSIINIVDLQINQVIARIAYKLLE